MARGKNKPKGKHGGYRAPAKPAAVSTPGSGARTDGGAGSRRQPLRVPTGQPYGEAKRLEEAQRGAPLAASPSGATQPPATPQAGTAGGAGGPGIPGPLAADMSGGLFGPTQRPNEPPNAGIAQAGEQMLGADQILRAMIRVRPSPWLMGLLDHE